MARAWLAKKLLIRNLDALNRGDAGPILRMETDDVHFRFPGSSSWAADTVGKAHVEAWLKRLVATGLQHRAEEVVVSGPPWRMSLVLRGTDHFEESDGTPVYDNRYVIWARTRWGRIYDYEAYEDTERSLAFDSYRALRMA